MNRVTKSIKIDPELWREVKVHCAKEDTDISTYIEGLIKENLKKK
jgi:hypothetical protein